MTPHLTSLEQNSCVRATSRFVRELPTGQRDTSADPITLDSMDHYTKQHRRGIFDLRIVRPRRRRSVGNSDLNDAFQQLSSFLTIIDPMVGINPPSQ